MWKNRQNHIKDESLDRLGDALLKASEVSEMEINTAATSPFLYRRIRVRIEAEERRRAEERNPWATMLLQMRRAIPALAMLAVVAVVSSWYLHSRSMPAANETVSETVTIADVATLSQDELVVSLVGWDTNRIEQEESQ